MRRGLALRHPELLSLRDRLKEVLSADVVLLLCFAQAFVEGCVCVRDVRVLQLRWLKGEIATRFKVPVRNDR